MFVGGLDKETSDEEFRALFESFGEINEAAIIKKDDSKSDRLFGFITFAKCDDLDDCLLARPHKYKEKELDVKRAVPKGQFDGTGHFKVKKLHLGNIPEKFDTAGLLKYLKSRHPKKYGAIEEVDILKAKDESGNATEKNRGFGFITVSSEDFADRIAIAESKFTLDGNALELAKPNLKPVKVVSREVDLKAKVSEVVVAGMIGDIVDMVLVMDMDMVQAMDMDMIITVTHTQVMVVHLHEVVVVMEDVMLHINLFK